MTHRVLVITMILAVSILAGSIVAGAAADGSSTRFSLHSEVAVSPAPCTGGSMPGSGSEQGSCFRLGRPIIEASRVTKVVLVELSANDWQAVCVLNHTGRQSMARFLRTHPSGTPVGFVVSGSVVGTARTTAEAAANESSANVVAFPSTMTLAEGRLLARDVVGPHGIVKVQRAPGTSLPTITLPGTADGA